MHVADAKLSTSLTKRIKPYTLYLFTKHNHFNAKVFNTKTKDCFCSYFFEQGIKYMLTNFYIFETRINKFRIQRGIQFFISDIQLTSKMFLLNMD